MSEREDLIVEIDELRLRLENLAQLAWQAEKSGDHQKADLYDEWRDRTSNEIGRLHARLWEIEARESRKVMLWDAAYGRSL